MKMLPQARLPNGEFNAAVRDGTAGKKRSRVLEETKPEVEFHPVMSHEDLKKAGLEALGEKWA
ncbi:MAG: hypothetical protein ACT4PV_16265 [Planctomycetaceae bacterium]